MHAQEKRKPPHQAPVAEPPQGPTGVKRVVRSTKEFIRLEAEHRRQILTAQKVSVLYQILGFQLTEGSRLLLRESFFQKRALLLTAVATNAKLSAFRTGAPAVQMIRDIVGWDEAFSRRRLQREEMLDRDVLEWYVPHNYYDNSDTSISWLHHALVAAADLPSDEYVPDSPTLALSPSATAPEMLTHAVQLLRKDPLRRQNPITLSSVVAKAILGDHSKMEADHHAVAVAVCVSTVWLDETTHHKRNMYRAERTCYERLHHSFQHSIDHIREHREACQTAFELLSLILREARDRLQWLHREEKRRTRASSLFRLVATCFASRLSICDSWHQSLHGVLWQSEQLYRAKIKMFVDTTAFDVVCRWGSRVLRRLHSIEIHAHIAVQSHEVAAFEGEETIDRQGISRLAFSRLAMLAVISMESIKRAYIVDSECGEHTDLSRGLSIPLSFSHPSSPLGAPETDIMPDPWAPRWRHYVIVQNIAVLTPKSYYRTIGAVRSAAPRPYRLEPISELPRTRRRGCHGRPLIKDLIATSSPCTTFTPPPALPTLLYQNVAHH